MKQPTTFDKTPAPASRAVSRRSFLGSLALVATGASVVSLAGCAQVEQWAGAREPQAHAGLVELYARLDQLAKSQATPPSHRPLIETHRQLVRDEWIRLCGQDEHGEAPAACVDIAQASRVADIPELTGKQVQELMFDVISTAPETATEDDATARVPDSALITAMAAAWSGITDAPSRDGVAERPSLHGFVPPLEAAHSACVAAIYGTGHALVHAGENKQLVEDAATDLRELRDALAEGARAVGHELQPAPAGFLSTEQLSLPEAAGDVAPFLAAVLQPIIGAMCQAIPAVTDEEDRGTLARWCAVVARKQCAAEKATGRNPLQSTLRGLQR